MTTAREMAAALDRIEVAVNALTDDPRDWDRDQIDAAVEVWERLDSIIASLALLRRDHGLVLARRLPDEYTAPTRRGAVTVHRNVSTSETWDGHEVIGALATEVIDANGERISAIPVDVARAVIPSCKQGQTSSKWKITELRKVVDDADRYRHVVYGDATIGRGPLPAPLRNRRPQPEPAPDGG
jgi:hypothetical protein